MVTTRSAARRDQARQQELRQQELVQELRQQELEQELEQELGQELELVQEMWQQKLEQELEQLLEQSKVPAPAPPPPPALVMACSICLRSPTDPVMTICGHLYCWPCIYQWLGQSVEVEDQRHQLFPVPKTCPMCRYILRISVDIFPIYATLEPWTHACTGGRPLADDGADGACLDIPRRPHPPIVSTYAYMLQPQLL